MLCENRHDLSVFSNIKVSVLNLTFKLSLPFKGWLKASYRVHFTLSVHVEVGVTPTVLSDS